MIVLASKPVYEAITTIGIAVYLHSWLRDEREIIQTCAKRLYESGRYSGTPAQHFLREASIQGIPNFSVYLRRAELHKSLPHSSN